MGPMPVHIIALYVGPMQYFTLPRLFHVESMEWGMDSILLVDGFHGMGDGFHTFGGWIPYFFQMDSIPFPAGFHTFSSWNKFLESSIHTHALKFKLEWGLID